MATAITVSAGSDTTLGYNASPQTVNLTAVASGGNGGPFTYQWTMLEVPSGSSANVGSNGDFTNGVSSVQNPSFDTDGGIAGSYTLQCVAFEGSSSSSPTTDKGAAQQNITVETEELNLLIPSKCMYDWDTLVNFNFTTLESESSKVKVSSNDTTRDYLLDKLVAGTNVTITENNDGASETLTIASTGGGGSQTMDDTYNEGRTIGIDSGEILLEFSSGGSALRVNKESSNSGTANTPFINQNLEASEDTVGYGASVSSNNQNVKVYNALIDNDALAALTSGKIASGYNVGITGDATDDAASFVKGFVAELLAATGGTALAHDIIGTGWDYALRAASGAVELNDGHLMLAEISSDPAQTSNKASLYVKDVSGVPELFFRDDTNSPLQLTDNGNTAGSEGLGIPHEESFETDGTELVGDLVDFGALNATPRGGGTADTPSGYDIQVYRSGLKLKPVTVDPVNVFEFRYLSGSNEVRVYASSIAEDYDVVYGE